MAPRRRQITISYNKKVVIETGLPSVDTGLLTVQQQLDNALVREPLEHVLWEPPTWRYRVGEWRFFYEVDEMEKTAFLVAADHRKQAYRAR